jgi:phosphoglycerate dehydrogenase-like enzyme
VSTADRGAKPAVLIAHHPRLALLGPAEVERLRTIVTVLNPTDPALVPISDWTTAEARALLAEADIVLGHWGCPRLSADVVAAAPRLRYLVYGAGTVKSVVSDAVFEAGVVVTSCADANAEPVAEFTLGAILLANKDVFWRRDLGRDPSIAARRQAPTRPVGNWDKTIGLVGASMVGRRVIERLRPFPHLRIALHDPFVSPVEAGELGVELLGLDQLCAAADILSIHAPDLPSTHHMIGAPQLAALRTGATVINTARGRLVDHDALVAECASGRLFAILDVTDPEPLPRDHPLRSLPTVYLTPHLAGSEGTELGRLLDGAIDEVQRIVDRRPPRNPVSRSQLDTMA